MYVEAAELLTGFHDMLLDVFFNEIIKESRNTILKKYLLAGAKILCSGKQ